MSATVLAEEDGPGQVIPLSQLGSRSLEPDLALFEEDGPIGDG